MTPHNLDYPAVDSSFSASYDFAMAALAGIITQINANYELTKTLSVIPQGELGSSPFPQSRI